MNVFCFLTLGQLRLGGCVGNNSWIWDKRRGKEKEEEEVVKEERISTKKVPFSLSSPTKVCSAQDMMLTV